MKAHLLETSDAIKKRARRDHRKKISTIRYWARSEALFHWAQDNLDNNVYAEALDRTFAVVGTILDWDEADNFPKIGYHSLTEYPRNARGLSFDLRNEVAVIVYDKFKTEIDDYTRRVEAGEFDAEAP
jgi:hypothetical protein